MKKIIYLIIALALLLNGCYAAANTTNNTNKTDTGNIVDDDSSLQQDNASMLQDDNASILKEAKLNTTLAVPTILPRTEIPEKEEGPYTIAWISDTQYYSESFPDTFTTMTNYLATNKDELNLKYVLHTGDVTNNGNKENQWKNAKKAMEVLDRADIPYGIAAGNHDVKKLNYTNYSKYFGNDILDAEEYCKGTYKNNRNHYDLLTLGETDFIFVFIGYQPNEESVAWANEVLKKYPDRIGALVTHDYMNAEMNLRNNGRILRDQVVIPNKNVYMVLCGHRYTEGTKILEVDDNNDGITDRKVYQSIANYQAIDKKGGSGYIRLLEIDDKKGSIRFSTYSPLLDKYYKESTEMPIPW